MTLEEHAKAIEDAIQAAHNDGFELDDGNGEPIHVMELNAIHDGSFDRWVYIDLPEPTYY
ncbi:MULTISPECIES: hypothetical protein [unclassified Streptomyces]|uniref:hypothetical protein n=1 Tax=unclassified Streptomyces TaxID=2593676 RepID=UPI000382A454|nr:MULTISPECIES: hypothetical protein [unclassified Streptomyces]